MKKITLTLLLPLVLLTSSCRKNSGPTTVEGQVVDMYSKKPIPNAVVFLATSSGPTGLGYSTSEVTKANASGNFSFTFEASESALYELLAGIDDLYWPKSNDGVNIQKGRKNHGLTLECQPVGWVKVNLVNTVPRDSVYIINILGFFKPRSLDLPYVYRDTSIIGLCLEGGEEKYFGYWITPMSGDTVFKYLPKIFLAPLDTTEITINY